MYASDRDHGVYTVNTALRDVRVRDVREFAHRAGSDKRNFTLCLKQQKLLPLLRKRYNVLDFLQVPLIP